MSASLPYSVYPSVGAGSSPVPPPPPVVQNLSQVLTIGNSATNQNISFVNEIRANQLTPLAPIAFDLPNDGSLGLYAFKIQQGSYNQNSLSNIPHSTFLNLATGFPTEQTSINLDNKSLNADTRIMSQYIDYPASSLLLAPGASVYCLNFGTQFTGQDECYYDPMNMRVFYDFATNSWIACSTPNPFNLNLILGSWTIITYLVGAWDIPTTSEGRVILEQWRSGILYKQYPVLSFNGLANKKIGSTSTFVLSGIYTDEWESIHDEWRAIITNFDSVAQFTIEKLNICFEWKQLS